MTATPDWLPTARALAAVWDGPPLVQFVVSEGEPSHLCLACEVVSRMSESDDGLCPRCGEGCWKIDPTYRDRDTVADMSSGPGGLANEGPLRAHLCGLSEHVIVRFDPHNRKHLVQIGGAIYQAHRHAAESLAVAFLAVKR